ncbi:MAG: tryptophan synthase subunit alpha [Chloroflexi bacterium RBG_16_64_32]|nr:MAG: tryptophan synthase subunit alpha [Chloroflexi bacterium RBG_16_64_32]
MSRIADTFARLRAERRTGLIAFLTVGYPSVKDTLRLVPALIDGGADIVELGVPFSDPLAEGPTIQRSSHHALMQGVTPRICLEVLAELRGQGVESPLIVMGYFNPLLAYGLEEFCRDAASAGADGIIVVDLPPEESHPLRDGCRAHGLDLIYLLAPTSTDERIGLAVGLASGFVYCVSVTGVTGARDELPPGLSSFVDRVRARTRLPVAVGFGISKRKHFRAVGRMADAAVIGSAIIDEIDRCDPSERASNVKRFAEVVTGRRRAAD